jgi:predicted nucleic acid-binding protein
MHGPAQITDIYLLALAVQHGGRFVTFDTAISRDAVKGASASHLLTL